jgi:stage V sporulation protein SpoVS
MNPLRAATFCCDATPPFGQPMIAGDPVRVVEQTLWAKGIVLEAGGRRYVLCAIDWCELNNGSHDSMQNSLAAAAGTAPACVAVHTVHQHTAPVVDMDAGKLLAAAGAARLRVDPQVFAAIERRLADVVKTAVGWLEPVDRIGVGQAKVERVAATRRPLDAAGKIAVRYSSCRDAAVRALPEGTIDPWLKTITLARGHPQAGTRPLVRLHYYATHPQTAYGDGRASSDMVGDAREALQQEEGVFQVYFDGCGGDITVGKYNDGSKLCRRDLAGRLLAGMEAAIAATHWSPPGAVRWRTFPLVLPPRSDRGYSLADSLARMQDAAVQPSTRLCAGAERAAFHQRAARPITVSCLEIGNISIVHLPGEPMIDFQLFAQRLRPERFVAVAGYGDCGPGYLCPARAFAEGGYEPSASNVQPESEALLKRALCAVLGTE